MKRALALGAGLLLAGCQMFKGGGESVGAPAPAGVEAPLQAIGGSAADGSVRFLPRAGGVTMLVHLTGVTPGEYRVIVHANGNCSSPNGFSAGPPWTPPGSPTPLAARMPVVVTNSEGSGTTTARIAGLSVEGPDGLTGKSVVIHEGAQGSLDAQPDVRNNRVACGVIGPLRSVF